jgi:hypothetical protein
MTSSYEHITQENYEFRLAHLDITALHSGHICVEQSIEESKSKMICALPQLISCELKLASSFERILQMLVHVASSFTEVPPFSDVS